MDNPHNDVNNNDKWKNKKDEEHIYINTIATKQHKTSTASRTNMGQAHENIKCQCNRNRDRELNFIRHTFSP